MRIPYHPGRVNHHPPSQENPHRPRLQRTPSSEKEGEAPFPVRLQTLSATTGVIQVAKYTKNKVKTLARNTWSSGHLNRTVRPPLGKGSHELRAIGPQLRQTIVEHSTHDNDQNRNLSIISFDFGFDVIKLTYPDEEEFAIAAEPHLGRVRKV